MDGWNGIFVLMTPNGTKKHIEKMDDPIPASAFQELLDKQIGLGHAGLTLLTHT